MLEIYIEVIHLCDRVRYAIITVIKDRLNRMGLVDIHPIDVIILLNVNHTKISVPETRNRLNYAGCHLNYLMRKLASRGYLLYGRGRDRRVAEVYLSDKGRELCDRFRELSDCISIAQPSDNLDHRAVWTLQQIEQFWIDIKLTAEQRAERAAPRDGFGAT
jgi:DNA-binding MarR family transcriptional regulator